MSQSAYSEPVCLQRASLPTVNKSAYDEQSAYGEHVCLRQASLPSASKFTVHVCFWWCKFAFGEKLLSGCYTGERNSTVVVTISRSSQILCRCAKTVNFNAFQNAIWHHFDTQLRTERAKRTTLDFSCLTSFLIFCSHISATIFRYFRRQPIFIYFDNFAHVFFRQALRQFKKVVWTFNVWKLCVSIVKKSFVQIFEHVWCRHFTVCVGIQWGILNVFARLWYRGYFVRE